MDAAYSDVININRDNKADANMNSQDGKQKGRKGAKQTQNVQSPNTGEHQIELSAPRAMAEPENVRTWNTEPAQIGLPADQGSVKYFQPPELHGTNYFDIPELPVADTQT